MDNRFYPGQEVKYSPGDSPEKQAEAAAILGAPVAETLYAEPAEDNTRINRLLDKIGPTVADMHSEEALQAIAAMPRKERMKRVSLARRALRRARKAVRRERTKLQRKRR